MLSLIKFVMKQNVDPIHEIVEWVEEHFKITETNKPEVKPTTPVEEPKVEVKETVKANVEVVDSVPEKTEINFSTGDDEPPSLDSFKTDDVPSHQNEVYSGVPAGLEFINNRVFTVEEAERRGCLPEDSDSGGCPPIVVERCTAGSLDSIAELDHQRQADYELLVKQAEARIERDIRLENKRRVKRLKKKIRKAVQRGEQPVIELKDLPFHIKKTD